MSIRFEGIEPALVAEAAPLDVTDRFDARKVWSTLDREQQDAIGTAALELVMSWDCKDVADTESPIYQRPLGRAGDAAEMLATGELLQAFVDTVPRAHAYTADGQPKIPAALGMVCARCGCSQDDACDDGFEPCGWAADHLCSHCAVPGVLSA